MGLDMYLYGVISEEPKGEKEGRPISQVKTYVNLGYWRKHPNLHGYIVKEFAQGHDLCQEIWLDESRLRRLIMTIKEEQLPYTEGFFFGASDGTEKELDLTVLNDALEWLRKPPKEGSYKSVIYRASW